MTKLQEFKFRDLLPASVRDAEKFVAAAQCLDELLAETDAQVKNAIIYARIDELDGHGSLTLTDLRDTHWRKLLTKNARL